MKNHLINAGVAMGGVAMQLLSKDKNMSDKGKHLSQQLQICKYPYSVVPYIIRAGEQISQQYPTLVSGILTFYQGNEQKNYIEFKGLVSVEYKNDKYGIQMHIMIPSNYPTQPPFVRIVNIDPSKFVADQFYIRMRSKNDQNSYLMSDLESIKKWTPLSKITSVIKEAQKLMSNVFPFKKSTSNQNYGYMNEYMPPQGWGSQGVPSYPPPNYGNMPFTQPQGMPVYQVSSLPNKPNDLPAYSSSANQKQPPIPFKQPPIPFKEPANQAKPTGQKAPQGKNPKTEQAQMQREDYIVRSQIFAADAKKSMDTLRQSSQKNFNNIQNLDITQKFIESLNEKMMDEIGKFNKFVKSQELNDNVDPLNLVVPADEQSKQLLELMSETKALDESWNFIESKFSEDKITFQQFLKMARKIEEDRFVSRYMLKKTKANLKL